ncbi:MAG TPA: MBL fold metallo-hydrolase [Chthonomonadales bacterium]|nr:MBL fold metallo-hydrolase [Chthonomonadales bacterium]
MSLGSGSSGNALFIEAGPRGRTSILIDAGFPGRILVERLRQAGVSPARLSGILVTHEHTDHIIGLPFLVKRYKIPALADPRTLAAIEKTLAYSSLSAPFPSLTYPSVRAGAGLGGEGTLASPAVLPDDANIPADEPEMETGIDDAPDVIEHGSSAFPVGSRRMIGDIEVRSFPVSHDAVAPCGYLLSAGGCRVCVVIDTGEVTDAMLEAINQADLLVLESNHDRERLLRGPYPYHLKQRILSPSGHLSNDQAAGAVLRTWRSDGVRWLWLSHLSRTNNTPRLALDSMRTRITEAKANPAQVHLSVLPPGLGCEWDSTQLWHQESLWEMPH